VVRLCEHLIASRARNRHAGMEDVGKLDHLAGLDKLYGIEHAFRPHEIAGTALVGGAPLDGQRALSGGTVQLGVWAMADVAGTVPPQ